MKSALERVKCYIVWRRAQPDAPKEAPSTEGDGWGPALMIEDLIVNEGPCSFWPLLNRSDVLEDTMRHIALDVCGRRSQGQVIDLEGWSEQDCDEILQGERPGMDLGQICEAKERWKQTHTVSRV